MADITFIPTCEGWPYPAEVDDLHPRRIVGWSMGEQINSRSVVDALEMPVAGRLLGEGLVAHSVRGSRSASEDHQRRLATQWIAWIMSRRRRLLGGSGSFRDRDHRSRHDIR